MRRALILLAFVLPAGAALAQGANNCGSLSASLSFGPAPYNVYAPADVTQIGTLSYRCGNKTAPVVSFSASANNAYRPRQMTAGANTLNYELYYDAAMTVVWGTGGDSQPVASGGGGKGLSVPFYGRIFAQQDAAIGDYSDTIIVTFNF